MIFIFLCLHISVEISGNNRHSRALVIKMTLKIQISGAIPLGKVLLFVK